MSSDDIQAFLSWLRPRANLWRWVRMRGIACRSRIDDPWLALRLLATLEGRETRNHNERGTNVVAFDECVPLERLAGLLDGLDRGEILAKSLQWSLPDLRLTDAGGCNLSGGTRSATMRDIGPEEYAGTYRFELELHRSRPSGTALMKQDAVASINEEFMNRGLGPVANVSRLLHLAGSTHDIFYSSHAGKLVAAVPAVISRVRQSSDRTKLEIRVDARKDLYGRLSLMALSIERGLREPVCQPITSRRTAVPIADDGPVQLTLRLDDRALQVEEVEPLPPFRASIRHIAQAAYLESETMLRDGLLPEGARNNDWFERSVAHLLSGVGFATLWWGRNRAGVVDAKFPMPDDTADVLLFSANDAVVAVVDATVDTAGKDKAHKLVQRAVRVTRRLASVFGATAPIAVPVLAVAVPLDEVPEAVRQIVLHDGGVILDRSQLEKLLQLIEAGASDRELRAALPMALRPGFASRRMLPVF